MSEIISYDGTYEQYKNMMECELREAAEGFVRIGYLLKIARDTDVLKNSGYKDVNEFAKAEYGLTRDVVSRYIEINTRYSEGGCSDRLQERYKAFGYSKLAEMLTLPETVAEELTPETTREEIREIKREIREEKEISDIEVMLEEEKESVKLDSVLEKAMYSFFEKNRETFKEFTEVDKHKIWEILAPAGQAMLSARVPQVGRFMISIKENNDKITMIDVRSDVKQEFDIEWLVKTIKKLTQYTEEELFGVETEEKTETPEPKKSLMDEPETECAPAQQENTATIMNQPDMNVESTDQEKTGDAEEMVEEVNEAAGEESEEAEVKEVVEEVKEVVKESQEAAGEEGQEAAAETVEESHEAAGEEAIEEVKEVVEESHEAAAETVEEDEEAAVAEEIKDPSWYGMRWQVMLEAFEELNGFFRTYRRRDMESQVIPRAKLKKIHEEAVNMAAEIEKAIGAGYGK